MNFKFSGFGRERTFCPAENDMVYCATRFLVVIFDNLQDRFPRFRVVGEEENEGLDLVEGFPEAACAKVGEPMLRLLEAWVLVGLRIGRKCGVPRVLP